MSTPRHLTFEDFAKSAFRKCSIELKNIIILDKRQFRREFNKFLRERTLPVKDKPKSKSLVIVTNTR